MGHKCQLAPGLVVTCLHDLVDTDIVFLRVFAEGKYPDGGQREGIVVRPMRTKRLLNERVSFKILNLKYKD